MAPRRSITWGPVIGAMVAGAALAGIMGWRLNVQGLEHRIGEKRSALKKLTLSGGIPPNQEVMDYLTSREASLQARYQEWLRRVTTLPPAEAASADPQLYFQEQFHEVQRTLERLAAARTMNVPEQLGFPKELPPSDTVPRLLVQLSLIRELAELIFEQGITSLASFKIEDPEPVPEEGGEGAFLVRLPVRVRLTGSLPQLIKILGAIERVSPLIDLRAIQVVSGTAPESLDVDLLLARYLAMAQEPPEAVPSQPATQRSQRAPQAGKKGAPRQTRSSTQAQED